MAPVQNARLGSSIHRNACDPYTILLGKKKFTLTDADLRNQVDATVQLRNNWSFPHLELMEIVDNHILLRNTYHEFSYELTLDIEPEKLHVSCDCGMRVKTLCIHAYKALDQLTWLGEVNFLERFNPKGFNDILNTYKKFFTLLKDRNVKSAIEPKDYLGSVYRLFDPLKQLHFSDLLKLPGATMPDGQTPRETGLAYLLIESVTGARLPFLQACPGTLNKNGTEIKQFDAFLHAPVKKIDKLLTTEQKMLNDLCFKMRAQTEHLPSSIIYTGRPEKAAFKALFNLWEEALPFVQMQDYVYKYFMCNDIELNGRPSKTVMRKINIRRERPILHFRLTEIAAFYQLEMYAEINGKQIKEAKYDMPLFIREGRNLYLLASVRDAGIVEWMDKCQNCITIFKEHFKEFETQYLKPLQNIYSVKKVSRKTISKRTNRPVRHTGLWK